MGAGARPILPCTHPSSPPPCSACDPAHSAVHQFDRTTVRPRRLMSPGPVALPAPLFQCIAYDPACTATHGCAAAQVEEALKELNATIATWPAYARGGCHPWALAAGVGLCAISPSLK